MLGYPGSGKTYFSQQLATRIGAVRLGADGIRHKMYKDEATRWAPASHSAVFGALDYAAHAVLISGCDVIYDASHNRRADRAKAEALARSLDITPIIIWVKTPLQTARKREALREITPDQPKVPADRLEALVGELQKPEPDEMCIIIDGTLPFDQQLAEFRAQIHTLLPEWQNG